MLAMCEQDMVFSSKKSIQMFQKGNGLFFLKAQLPLVMGCLDHHHHHQLNGTDSDDQSSNDPAIHSEIERKESWCVVFFFPCPIICCRYILNTIIVQLARIIFNLYSSGNVSKRLIAFDALPLRGVVSVSIMRGKYQQPQNTNPIRNRSIVSNDC